MSLHQTQVGTLGDISDLRDRPHFPADDSNARTNEEDTRPWTRDKNLLGLQRVALRCPNRSIDAAVQSGGAFPDRCLSFLRFFFDAERRLASL